METIRALREQLDAARGARRVAIVGMGVRAAGGISDGDSYWTALAANQNLAGEPPLDRKRLYGAEWDDLPARGGYLEDVFDFDARFFGISPREARSMDPQHRLLLEVVWEAFEDAAIRPADVGASAGVYVGITGQDHRALAGSDPNSYWTIGNGHCFAAGRIAYTLGLRGPALAIDTACSSSLVALHTAIRALGAGDCDVAVAAGVNLILTPRSTLEISRTDALSPDGRCLPFDARANGFVRGEGCAAVVLKRLDDAVRDRDRILAVVEGCAVNQDGRTSGFTAPNVESQTELISGLLDATGVAAHDIGYLEAHGTGTPLGDPIELEAVAAAIGRRAAGRTIHIGSVKANIGHTEAAAGLLGLIKAVLCLRHREILPQTGFETLNPRIDLSGTGITVPTTLMPWDLDAGTHAAVSSFGMSGTNAHAVISAAPAREPLPTTEPAGLLVTADTGTALGALVERYRARLAELDAAGRAAFAYTATHGRTRLRHAVWLDTTSPGFPTHPFEPSDPLPDEVRSVVSLPTYPWQRETHSIRPT